MALQLTLKYSNDFAVDSTKEVTNSNDNAADSVKSIDRF